MVIKWLSQMGNKVWASFVYSFVKMVKFGIFWHLLETNRVV